MSRAQFQIAFDGPALRAGSMDVNELAPALLSVGDLLREINSQINAGSAEVSVRVKADFQRGSFDVGLLLDQSLIEHARNLFTGTSLADAKQILEYAFGTTVATGGAIGVARSVLDVWKKLKGEKAKNIVRDDSKHITVIQIGDDNSIEVDPRTADLYDNDKIRASISGTVRPVSKPGVKALEIRRGKKVVDKITKDDLPAATEFTSSSGTTKLIEAPGVKQLADTREAMLRVTRVEFERGKWKFSDGTAIFAAEIADDEFKRRLDAREVGFYKGDTLRVRLATTQTIAQNGTFQTKIRYRAGHGAYPCP